MTLEALLKEAAAKGMTHLSVWPVASQDGKKTYWHAQATPSTGHSYVQTNSLDIVEAISETLKALPRAPKKTKQVDNKPRFDEVNPPLSEMAQREIGLDPGGPTATVSETSGSSEPGTFNDWMPKA